MNQYEIVYIIHPDLEGTTEKITEKMKSRLERDNGKVVREESWGKRKLAYPIKNNNFGIYQYLEAELEPSKVSAIERDFKLSEEVMRFLFAAKEEAAAPAKPRKKPVADSNEPARPVKKPVKKTEDKAVEKERLEKIDEKLKAIIGENDSSGDKSSEGKKSEKPKAKKVSSKTQSK